MSRCFETPQLKLKKHTCQVQYLLILRITSQGKQFVHKVDCKEILEVIIITLIQ